MHGFETNKTEISHSTLITKDVLTKNNTLEEILIKSRFYRVRKFMAFRNTNVPIHECNRHTALKVGPSFQIIDYIHNLS